MGAPSARRGAGCSKSASSSSEGAAAGEPAYDGAKFDVTGHCLRHPHVRLCRPREVKDRASKPAAGGDEDAKLTYRIVRKTCHLCGEHGLRNERKFNKKGWAHGYEPPRQPQRKSTPKDLVSADAHVKKTGASGSKGGDKASKRGGRGKGKGAEKQPPEKGSPSSPARSSTPPSTPESASSGSPSRSHKIELIKIPTPPPPMPPPEPKSRPTRERLRGAIPPGNTIALLCGRRSKRSKSRGRKKKSKDGAKDDARHCGDTAEATEEEDGSSGSRTEKTEKRNNKTRSKSVGRSRMEALRSLDHLRV